VTVPLPPLPKFGGETTGRNVVDVLTGQHRDLLALFGPDQAAPDAKIAQVIVATLSRHLSGEEQYLYPLLRAAVPGGGELADRELAEDHDLLVLLRRLDRGEPVMDDVTRAVLRHVEADAAELLPVLREKVPIEDLIRIGNRLETAEEAAPTRPHPATPSRPPWNKVVDPVVAVADKVRDTVTGRTTYARDLARKYPGD
jgi:hypothetical protein